jgi:iron complex transport system ATP-binding protein
MAATAADAPSPSTEARAVAPAIVARGLTCGYGSGDVLRDLCIELRDGEMLGVLGPNGCGKSTMIRALMGVLPPVAGEVLVRGRPLHRYSRRELARTVATVPQAAPQRFAFTVGETVMMGRTAHVGRFAPHSAADRAKVDEALHATDTHHLGRRFVTDLSGGEQQRVAIARALAQDTGILLLDEPTAHLDINHQMDIFDLLLGLCRERRMTVLCVSHDLNVAAEYCDRVALLRDGKVARSGSPEETLTVEALAEVYGIELAVVPNPLSGRPQVVIYRRYGEKRGGR